MTAPTAASPTSNMKSAISLDVEPAGAAEIAEIKADEALPEIGDVEAKLDRIRRDASVWGPSICSPNRNSTKSKRSTPS